jgi:hypothetical protein
MELNVESVYLVPSPPPALPMQLEKNQNSGERVRVRGRFPTLIFSMENFSIRSELKIYIPD